MLGRPLNNPAAVIPFFDQAFLLKLKSILDSHFFSSLQVAYRKIRMDFQGPGIIARLSRLQGWSDHT